jgi:hypothetical protein
VEFHPQEREFRPLLLEQAASPAAPMLALVDGSLFDAEDGPIVQRLDRFE